MIVQMKKLTLLCVAHDRAETLKALRELGVLHVTPVTSPAGTDRSPVIENSFRLMFAVVTAAAVPPLPPLSRTAEMIPMRASGATTSPSAASRKPATKMPLLFSCCCTFPPDGQRVVQSSGQVRRSLGTLVPNRLGVEPVTILVGLR